MNLDVDNYTDEDEAYKYIDKSDEFMDVAEYITGLENGCK